MGSVKPGVGMREKYESLPLATLKDVAKARGLKGISTMKKADLVDRMVAEDEKEAAQKAKTAPVKATPARAEGSRGPEKKDAPRYTAVREERREGPNRPDTRRVVELTPEEIARLDSGITANGILEVKDDGFGFIRSDNYMPGENDVYVAPAQIRRFNLKTGDILVGNTKVRLQTEKFSALLYLKSVNGFPPEEIAKRRNFEDMTPIFPHERLHLEVPGGSVANRIVDLISPIGKGQRGMIVAQPKVGKTTLLKEIAKSISKNHPEMHMIILLIDERPEEVPISKKMLQDQM